MDIFKLIYEHDLRLDTLRDRHTDRSTPETQQSIEDFFKPDPTYSKFYLTGTRIHEEKFGLNMLKKSDEIIHSVETALGDRVYHTAVSRYSKLSDFVNDEKIGSAIIITDRATDNLNTGELDIDDNSNVGHRKEKLAEVLLKGDMVLYKEKAKNGYDLHLFSKENIYKDLFFPLQNLVSDEFRFFSVNGKRINSERKFYFETWTLARPPHGAEEVFPETVL
ncbi:MAG TPA: hypothetical protein VKM36_12730 [Balneolaceae bacterium]|nr:hypothetical protein [Balneolaceae bacterium]